MENSNKLHCEMGSSRDSSQNVNKGSLLEECTSGGRKSRMRNQPYPTLFVKSLKEALGSAFSSRLRRAPSTPGREGIPRKKSELGKLQNGHSRNLKTISVGEDPEKAIDQGASGDSLSRNTGCTIAAGENPKTSTEELSQSQDTKHASLENCVGTEDVIPSSIVLYPRPLNRETTGYQPRQIRFTNPIVIQTSSEGSHNAAFLSFSGSRHSPHSLDPLSAKGCNRNLEMNLTSRPNRCSDPRYSTCNDADVVDSSVKRNYNDELCLSSRESEQSKIAVDQSRSYDNFRDCLSMEGRCSTTVVYPSRSNYDLIKVLSKENKPNDPIKRAGVNINRTFDLKSSDIDGSSPHASYKGVGKNDHTVNWSVNDILYNDAVVYPTLMDSMLSDPLVNVSFGQPGYSNTITYPGNTASRHNNTPFQPTSETWHHDIALHRTSRHSDTGANLLTKVYRQRNALVHPKSILRKPIRNEDYLSLNKTWHVAMESCRASVDSQLMSIKKQDPSCGIQACEKALNLLCLHDSSADEHQEKDLSFKSNFSSLDNGIQRTKLNRAVRIQGKIPAQEHVAGVVYPQALLRSPRCSKHRYNTSTTVHPSYTSGPEQRYNNESAKNCLQKTCT